MIEDMKVLTAYVDKFQVYEHMLSRIQYQFEEVEEVEELLADDEIRALYEYRLSAMIEENSRIDDAKEEALKRVKKKSKN